MKPFLLVCLTLASLSVAWAEEATPPAEPAATAINTLGLDLLAQTPPEKNTLLSPYSIQIALAMTYAGADGDTRAQMARVLHYPSDDVHASFEALNRQLNSTRSASEKIAHDSKRGGPNESITLAIANRLYGQKGYAFRPAYLDFLKEAYEAPMEQLDFQKNPVAATRTINSWVEKATRNRIRDLLPEPLGRDARLVLVNAIYFKAAWSSEFPADATIPAPFHTPAGTINVPTMSQEATLGYTKTRDYTALTIPYIGGDLQLLILLPPSVDGLPALEKKLTPDLLAKSASLPTREILLYLPKFKLQPPLFELSSALEKLGMPSAFNKPTGSANFDRIAPRKPGDYLYISRIYHKTFIAIDEQGTEAAAATAVVMLRYSMAAPSEPLTLRVDRPFLFAIQHRPSGACLFLGRMTNPSSVE